MKISNETKVGLLTIVALTLLIVGFNYLKGKDLFNRSKKIYAEFKDLGPLSKSNDVKINGYVIGKVYELKKKDKDLSGIVATITLSEDVNIPADSKAYISAPLVNSAFIVIERGTSATYIKSGDTINTRKDIGLLDDVKAQLNPTLTKVREVLDTLKQSLSGLNGLINPAAKENLHQTFANLNQASSSLNKLLNDQTGALAKTLDNASAITTNLKNNNDSITQTISNAKKFSEKLTRLDLQKTMDSVNAMLSQLKRTVAKISSNDGTLGALINDKQLYNKLNDVILGAEILMDDLRVHPKRYTGSIIFNRKDKTGPLTSPSKKDSIPPDGNK